MLETAPGEISVYWRQHSKGDVCRLRRGTVRTDGFVSVNAGYGGGELVTRPLTFEGRELVINYSTSAFGSVQVELQDAAGSALDGYSLAQCPVIYGDDIEHKVSWVGGVDVSALAGQTVRLRFALKGRGPVLPAVPLRATQDAHTEWEASAPTHRAGGQPATEPPARASLR